MRKLVWFGAAGAALALAACSAPPPPPPPPPPPAPVVLVIPPRPMPPAGATASLAIPTVGTDGLHHTPLSGQAEGLKLWNLRSAFNVAALNCSGPQYAELTPAYSAFLKKQARALTLANKAVDTEFRQRDGKAFLHQREAYLTQLYNFYAFPPTLPAFCDEALDISRDSAGIAAKDLPAFADRHLGHVSRLYEAFYAAYDRYRADLAAWEAKYGAAAAAASSAAVVPGPAVASAREASRP
ncbi:MAG TPA: hypothetical protein VFF98_09025 [Novosphingobium sp.]|nr:hypothetical protein [Novosphingobium sp.]HZV10468.1 hypothetical protein [Novosphingobium sp.]